MASRVPVPASAVFGCALVLAALACAPEPFYSDDIGVEAIPIEAGEAAGTFALQTINTTLVHLPAGLEDEKGGGVNFRLVERTWDADTETYVQESRLCGGFNYPVAGVVTSSPESTYRKVARSTKEKVTVSEGGAYDSTGHLQLWGLRDLPEPYETNLPAREDAESSPWDDRIFDMDDDDQRGFTLFVGGVAGDGEIYAIQRKTVDLYNGVTLGPDRMIGLAKNKNEALTIGASNPLIDRQSEGSAEPHPDPLESWFEEIRISDGADCDDVMKAADDEKLAKLRPF